MSQGAPIQHLPLEIVGVATMHKLGTPERLFGPTKEPVLGRLMGICSIIIGCLIIIAFFLTYDRLFSWWPAWQIGLILLIALAWLMLGAWILLAPMNDHRLRVFLCREGLIYVRKKPEAIRWNQMERIWKNVMGDADTDDAPVYIVRRSDDILFTFDGELELVEELGLRLEVEITHRLLPRAIAAFDAKGPVVFDEIVVSQRGIGVKEGRKWLSWQEFAGISMGETSITIYEKSSGAWATVTLASVPNVAVLQRLIEHVVREQALSQLPQIVDFNAGRVVHFGAISMSKDNFVIDGDKSGKITFAWNDVASIGITQSEVIVRRRGALREWYTLPVWQVKDAAILKDVIAYVMRRRVINNR
jgi:Family of unknown function (DUF6585)